MPGTLNEAWTFFEVTWVLVSLLAARLSCTEQLPFPGGIWVPLPLNGALLHAASGS